MNWMMKYSSVYLDVLHCNELGLVLLCIVLHFIGLPCLVFCVSHFVALYCIYLACLVSYFVGLPCIAFTWLALSRILCIAFRWLVFCVYIAFCCLVEKYGRQHFPVQLRPSFPRSPPSIQRLTILMWSQRWWWWWWQRWCWWWRQRWCGWKMFKI